MIKESRKDFMYRYWCCINCTNEFRTTITQPLPEICPWKCEE